MRGAIILITLFHFPGGGDFPGKMFISYAVDVFLFLSGFGIAISLRSKTGLTYEKNILSFYKRRLIRIFPACCIAGICSSQIGIYANSPDVLDFFGLGTWYIRTLCILYIISPFIYYVLCNLRWKGVFILAFLNAVIFIILRFCLFEYYEGYGVIASTCFWTLSRAMSFIQGMAITILSVSNCVSRNIFLYVVTGCFVTLAFVLKIRFQETNNWDFLYLSWFVFSIATFHLSKALSFVFGVLPKYINSVLKWVGRYSLELYLSHLTVYPLLLIVLECDLVMFPVYFGTALFSACMLKLAANLVTKAVDFCAKN